MRDALYIVALVALGALALSLPRYVGYAAIAFAIVTACWFYFSLRGSRRVRGDASVGTALIGVVVVVSGIYLTNSLGDEGTQLAGTVINCIHSTQRLTGRLVVACTAKLENGSVENLVVAGMLQPGAVVYFQQYRRRFFGSHYQFMRTG